MFSMRWATLRSYEAQLRAQMVRPSSAGAPSKTKWKRL
jgi:hypothetical protein